MMSKRTNAFEGSSNPIVKVRLRLSASSGYDPQPRPRVGNAVRYSLPVLPGDRAIASRHAIVNPWSKALNYREQPTGALWPAPVTKQQHGDETIAQRRALLRSLFGMAAVLAG